MLVTAQQLITEICEVFGNFLPMKNVSIGYLFKCHEMTDVDDKATCSSVIYEYCKSKAAECLIELIPMVYCKKRKRKKRLIKIENSRRKTNKVISLIFLVLLTGKLTVFQNNFIRLFR